MKKLDISIIIPNYNGKEILRKNLPKVIVASSQYKNGKVEIIIPDDASSDGSNEFIQEFITSIKEKHIIGKTIANFDREKGGFSANVNRGVKIATGDILILLNSDVAPHKDFLEYLLPHFANDLVFAVGCMDESVEGDRTVLRGRGIGKWKKGFLVHQAGELGKEDTLWVSGGSGAFRRSIWDKLGGLYNIYNPFYWEDIDLSYRARKAGFLTLFESRSRVVHEHSKGAIKTLYKPFRVQKTVYRNQFFFAWLNATDASLIFSHIFWLPYHLINALRDRNWALLSGFYLAILQMPRVLQLRAKNKKLFTKSDTEILVTS